MHSTLTGLLVLGAGIAVYALTGWLAVRRSWLSYRSDGRRRNNDDGTTLTVHAVSDGQSDSNAQGCGDGGGDGDGH